VIPLSDFQRLFHHLANLLFGFILAVFITTRTMLGQFWPNYKIFLRVGRLPFLAGNNSRRDIFPGMRKVVIPGNVRR
jgi:hypothetical protein